MKKVIITFSVMWVCREVYFIELDMWTNSKF